MKLKYYLRGLAVGILVTTVLLMVAGRGHKTAMSDNEIIARAKQLGMVMDKSQTGSKEDLFVKDSQKEDTENTENTEDSGQVPVTKTDTSTGDDTNTQNTDGSDAQTQPGADASQQDGQTDPNAQQNADAAQQSADNGQAAESQDAPQYVEVIVSPGEYCRAVSEDLASKGLVSDSESFRKYMLEIKQDELISSGVYQIPVGASYEEIAKILISGNN